MRRARAAAALSLLLPGHCVAHSVYRAEIPNGDRVIANGALVPGVGHAAAEGGGPRNLFGLAFAAAGRAWTQALCLADSDGDGQSNGLELGDPACTWVKGNVPAATSDISHPGVAVSMTARSSGDGGGGDGGADCPAVGPGTVGICVEECDADAQTGCSAGQVCCSNGCGHVCMDPGDTAGPTRGDGDGDGDGKGDGDGDADGAGDGDGDADGDGGGDVQYTPTNNMVTASGYVMDILCNDAAWRSTLWSGWKAPDGSDPRRAPADHSAECLLLPQCLSSGFGIMTQTGAEFRVQYRLSAAANAHVAAYLNAIPCAQRRRATNVIASATGRVLVASDGGASQLDVIGTVALTHTQGAAVAGDGAACPGGGAPSPPAAGGVEGACAPSPVPGLSCRAAVPGSGLDFHWRTASGSAGEAVSVALSRSAAAGRRALPRQAGWLALGVPDAAGKMVPSTAFAAAGGAAPAQYRVSGYSAGSIAASSALPVGALASVSGALVVTDLTLPAGTDLRAVPLLWATHPTDPTFPSQRHASRGGFVADLTPTGGAGTLRAVGSDYEEEKRKRRIHGWLMVAAWAFAAPLGIVVKHVGTPLVSAKVGGYPAPFVVHALLMLAAVGLTAGGAILAWTQFEQRARHSHRELGLLVLFFALYQPLPALFCRPDAPKPGEKARTRRVIWYAVHVIGAMALFALALATGWLGVRNYEELWDADEAEGFWVAGVCGVCVICGIGLLLALALAVLRPKKAGAPPEKERESQEQLEMQAGESGLEMHARQPPPPPPAAEETTYSTADVDQTYSGGDDSRLYEADPFPPGCDVSAMYGNEMWPGKVYNKQSNGLYTVVWDDGSHSPDVHPESMVRR